MFHTASLSQFFDIRCGCVIPVHTFAADTVAGSSFSFFSCSAQVEASYEGPVLEGEVTMEFMLEMMAHFKAQKKLHRKVALDVSTAAARAGVAVRPAPAPL